jgi:hypothetical protein
MIEATARHHALHGFDEVQVFQGKLCWKSKPQARGAFRRRSGPAQAISTTPKAIEISRSGSATTRC